MSVKVGIIGYGLAGRVFHAPLLAPAGLLLTAVASSKAELVHQQFPDVTVHSEVDDLLNDSNVDLVVLASPSSTHADLAQRALAAGKHVVVDKPFAATVEEANAVIKAANQAGKVVTCFQNRRWDSDFLTLKKLIDSGELGDITNYRAHFEFFKPEVQDAWQEKPAPGVGIQYDLGAHLIDQALVLFGLPDWVEGDVLIQREAGQIADTFHVRMGKGTLRIDLFGSYFSADFSTRYAVHGSKGSYMKSHMDCQEQQLRDGLTPADTGYGIEAEEDWAHVTTLREGVLVKRREPSVAGCHHHFYKELQQAIIEGSAPPVLATEARDTIQLIEAVMRSSETGARVILSDF